MLKIKDRLVVCHIISGDLWAGAEVMALRLIQQLQRFGNLNLRPLLLNNGRLAAELRKLGLPVTVLDETRLAFPRLSTRVHTFIRQWSPHVIHSHRYKENILSFLGRGLWSRARLVATQHGLPETNIGRFKTSSRLVARLNNYILAHRFDQLVAVSKDIKSNYVEYLGFKPEKVSVIYNGIDLPGLTVTRDNRPRLTVGSAGRLMPVKDYLLMVQIAHTALANDTPLTFELAGEGPVRPVLEERISGLGIERFFRLRGHLDDMDAFYPKLDIYLNTSVHEGIPMSILEAMSRGLPIIAPKVGGIVEIITNGGEGFLISKRTPSAFAEKLLLLQRNHELRRRMGLAAREKVMRHFSVEAMARQYECLYRSLVDDRTGLRLQPRNNETKPLLRKDH